MKMKITLTGMLLLFSFPLLFAQIPNFDFELWTDVGDWEDPDGWYTLNALYNGEPETVKLTEDAFSGLSAVRMENEEDDNDNVVRATLSSGTNNPSDNPGFPFSTRPYSLDGYFIYSPKGNDSCYVFVNLTRFNTSTQSNEIIGSGAFSYGDELEEYTLFSVPMNYVSSEFPDSASIVIYAGKLNGPKEGSRLYIDALTFNETTTTGIAPVKDGVSISLFPNPAQDYFTIQHFSESVRGEILLYDFTGVLKKSVAINKATATVKVDDLIPGIYFYEIRNENNEVVKSGKMMVEQ
ncbi:MAG: T9SS type A sorting domain-containing protein [Chitinophagales bacterium]